MKTCELLKIVLKIMEIDDIYKDQIDTYKQDFTECRKHLIKSWWHDVSIIPKKGNYYIIYTSTCNMFNIVCNPTGLKGPKLAKKLWEDFVKNEDVIQWAYMEEFLPKNE